MTTSSTIESKGSTTQMQGKKSLKIKIYADGANLDEMVAAYKNGLVDGFTTNPTLMRKAGVTEYEKFAKEVLSQIKDVSISFEVFSDEFPEMERQARKIHSWAKNVHVKIPVINTQGTFTGPLIQKLAKEGIPMNITAILTLEQVKKVSQVLEPNVSSIVSVFAGRIADTGVDPVPMMKESAQILKALPKSELLWASSREFINVIQAQECGCHIITVTPDIIKKLGNMGKDLYDVSLETVKIFYDDGQKAGFKL